MIHKIDFDRLAYVNKHLNRMDEQDLERDIDDLEVEVFNNNPLNQLNQEQ